MRKSKKNKEPFEGRTPPTPLDQENFLWSLFDQCQMPKDVVDFYRDQYRRGLYFFLPMVLLTIDQVKTLLSDFNWRNRDQRTVRLKYQKEVIQKDDNGNNLWLPEAGKADIVITRPITAAVAAKHGVDPKCIDLKAQTDGQHTCEGMVSTNTSVLVTIAFNAKYEHRGALDKGSPRTTVDNLTLGDTKAEVVRMAEGILRNLVRTNDNIPPDDYITAVKDHLKTTLEWVAIETAWNPPNADRKTKSTQAPFRTLGFKIVAAVIALIGKQKGMDFIVATIRNDTSVVTNAHTSALNRHIMAHYSKGKSDDGLSLQSGTNNLWDWMAVMIPAWERYQAGGSCSAIVKRQKWEDNGGKLSVREKLLASNPELWEYHLLSKDLQELNRQIANKVNAVNPNRGRPKGSKNKKQLLKSVPGDYTTKPTNGDLMSMAVALQATKKVQPVP